MGPPLALGLVPDTQFLRDSDLTQTVHRYQAQFLQSTTALTSSAFGATFLCQASTWASTLSLAYVSLGVIFGDIGTSPLFVFSATFTKEPTEKDVLGVLSIVFWTLTVFVLLKYVLVVLHASDHGEGGTFAMYSVLCRTIGVLPHHSWGRAEATIPPLQVIRQTTRPCWHSDAGAAMRRWLGHTYSAQLVLMVAAIVATAMLIGDGVLTPAISILSAVAGLRTSSAQLEQPAVVGIACTVVVILFVVQSLGTQRLSRVLSPIVLVWLLSNLGINFYNLASYGGGVFRSVSPHYIVQFFHNRGKEGWVMLGGTLLCMTGAEAMFAELGNVSHTAIALSFCCLVYPCLIITYMGQAAYLIHHPQHYKDVFWHAVPKSVFWPMIVISIAAAAVASQALITGCFSVIRQAMNLGLFPKLRVVHTSTKKEGQIYIAEVNYALMLLTIVGIAGFQDTAKLGTAYGLSVMVVMVITTCMVSLVMLVVWELSPLLVVPWFVVYFAVEVVYLSANLYKVPQGGWFTLAIAGVVTVINIIWWGGNHVKMQRLDANKLALNEVIQLDVTPAGDRLVLAGSGSLLPLARPIGLGIYYNEGTDTGVPAVMVHMLRNLHAAHQVVVILTVRVLPMPHLPRAKRLVVRLPGGGVRHFYQVVVRYGYMDRIDHGSEFVDGLVDTIRASLNSAAGNGYLLAGQPASIQVALHAGSVFLGSGGWEGDVLQLHVLQQVDQDVQALLNARQAAVVYYMGRHIVGEAQKGNLWHALVCGPVYAAMERNSFADVDAFKVPSEQLVDLCMQLHL